MDVLKYSVLLNFWNGPHRSPSVSDVQGLPHTHIHTLDDAYRVNYVPTLPQSGTARTVISYATWDPIGFPGDETRPRSVPSAVVPRRFFREIPTAPAGFLRGRNPTCIGDHR